MFNTVEVMHLPIPQALMMILMMVLYYMTGDSCVHRGALPRLGGQRRHRAAVLGRGRGRRAGRQPSARAAAGTGACGEGDIADPGLRLGAGEDRVEVGARRGGGMLSVNLDSNNNAIALF
jgi:hypothetical protein